MGQQTVPPDSTRMKKSNDPRLVWHYTRIDGLRGILQTNRLWATAPRDLNDDGELRYGSALVQRIWMSVRQDLDIQTGLVRFINRILENEYLEELLASIFIASASNSPDLLPQWRAYSKLDGLAIGLNRTSQWWPIPAGEDAIPQPDPKNQRLPPYFDLFWREAIYDKDTQNNNALQLLKFFERQFMTEADSTCGYFTCRAMLAQHIARSKDPAFVSEDELRLWSSALGQKVQSRTNDERTIAYINLATGLPQNNGTIQAQRLPIGEIRCGPTTSKDAVECVRGLLDDHGYQEATLSRSTLPVRW